MKKANKYLGIILAIAITGSCLTGCSGNKAASTAAVPSKGEKAKLTILIYAQEHEKAAYQKLIEKFKAANKDTVESVDLQVTTQDEYKVKMTAATTSNKLPDIFYVGPDTVRSYVDNKHVLALDDLIAKNSKINISDIWPQIIKAYQYDGTKTGQGKLYALPKDLSTFAYAYNKDMFDKAGVAYPDPNKPYTWEEFAAVCQKLTKDSNGKTADQAEFDATKTKQWGAGFADAFMFTPFVYGNGATFLNADYTKVTIAEQPKFKDALQYYVDLTLKYKVTPTVKQDAASGFYQRWLAGQLGFYACGTWDIAAFNDKKTLPFNWDLCGWPVGSSGKSITWNGSVGFAVSATSKYPTQALDLISYLSVDKSGQEELSGATTGKSMQLPNIMSYAKGDYKTLVESKKIPYANNIDVIYNYIEGTDKYQGIFTETTYTYNSNWMDTFVKGMSNVKDGKVGVDDYIKQIQPKMQKELDAAIKLQNSSKK